jgi:hypothetical protein
MRTGLNKQRVDAERRGKPEIGKQSGIDLINLRTIRCDITDARTRCIEAGLGVETIRGGNGKTSKCVPTPRKAS